MANEKEIIRHCICYEFRQALQKRVHRFVLLWGMILYLSPLRYTQIVRVTGVFTGEIVSNTNATFLYVWPMYFLLKAELSLLQTLSVELYRHNFRLNSFTSCFAAWFAESLILGLLRILDISLTISSTCKAAAILRSKHH